MNKIEPEKNEQFVVEYTPDGSADPIKLSPAIVRRYIASPNRDGDLPDDVTCQKFILECKAKKANPFIGDCFLIAHKDRNTGKTTWSTTWAMVFFRRRADLHPSYDGMESGVILFVEGSIEYRSGSFFRAGEKLEGGWAKAYRKDRTHPEFKSVIFSVYQGYQRWKTDPSGMIEKVAISQALRAAYPNILGDMYTYEEMEAVVEDKPKEEVKPLTTGKINIKAKQVDDRSKQDKSEQEGSSAHDKPTSNVEKPAKVANPPVKPTKKQLLINISTHLGKPYFDDIQAAYGMDNNLGTDYTKWKLADLKELEILLNSHKFDKEPETGSIPF